MAPNVQKYFLSELKTPESISYTAESDTKLKKQEATCPEYLDCSAIIRR